MSDNSFLKIKAPIRQTTTIPTPVQTAYAIPSGIYCRALANRINEQEYAIRAPRAGTSRLKPSLAFSILVPTTSRTIAIISSSQPFIAYLITD